MNLSFETSKGISRYPQVTPLHYVILPSPIALWSGRLPPSLPTPPPPPLYLPPSTPSLPPEYITAKNKLRSVTLSI